MKLDGSYKVVENSKLGNLSLIVGVIFALVSVIGYFNDHVQFNLSYMVSFFFWLSIALGGLFFTLLHHLTGAKWSTVLRKLSEAMAWTLPLFILLFIPIVFGLHDLFHWSHPEAVAADELLQKKEAFLNVPFFLIRATVYLTLWSLFAFLLNKISAKQDVGHDNSMYATMKKISAPGVIVFALTITFASFDWLMSLDAHWFSTIFGVYVFAGAFLAFLSFTVIIITYLRSKGILKDIITVEHYHDLGKLMLGFIIFWAYMGFSQYFLIWYANLPEENYWFLYRWDNSWEPVGMIIIFGHFVIPFIGTLFRAGKRKIGFITGLAVWILIMRYVDLYWLVMPTHYRDGLHFSIYDIAPFFAVGGLFLWLFWRNYTSKPVVPVNDPSLEYSIKFKNN